MKRLIFASAAAGALFAALYARDVEAFGLGMGDRFGKLGTSSQLGTAAPVITGKILLVNGSSFLLQVDGTSKICLAGGC